MVTQAKGKRTPRKIWVARQVRDSYWDDISLYVGAKRPEPETRGWDSEVRFRNAALDFCVPIFVRATGVKLKQGEVAELRVKVIRSKKAAK